jgi:hypothetical protein
VNTAGILGILAAIQKLTSVVDSWRQSEEMSKAELVALARSKDEELANFIDHELALLDGKAGYQR